MERVGDVGPGVIVYITSYSNVNLRAISNNNIIIIIIICRHWFGWVRRNLTWIEAAT